MVFAAWLAHPLGACHACIPHKARVNGIQLTRLGPPSARPVAQIYQTVIFFASAALGDVTCQRLL